MDIGQVKKILLKSMVPLVRRHQGYHALLINLHNLPLMEITACTKYIKTRQADSVYSYTIKSNNLCDSLNIKIVLLTENIERLIKHLDLDFEQFKKEMAEWIDMLDERRSLLESRTLPLINRAIGTDAEDYQQIELDKAGYLKRLVTNRLNRIFPYSREHT